MYKTLAETGQFSSRIIAYIELCKPRVVVLILLTALIGMFLATPYSVPINILFFGLLGIGFAASAGAVLNHAAEEQIDAIMQRTHRRPLPQGKVTAREAFIFGSTLLVAGFILLYFLINSITAYLTLITFVGYAGIYTLWLKHLTPQNIVIGGLAGSMPPLLGWTAVTGSPDAFAWLLVLIIFIWTPPHFWALAIARYEDYEKVNMPMLPVTHGIPCTKQHIFWYTILLSIISLLPTLCFMTGVIYTVTAILLNARFIYWAWLLKYSHTNEKFIAFKTFRYSIIYLTLLYLALLFDHYFMLNI